MKKYSIVVIISIIIGIITGYALLKKAAELDNLERANYNTLPYKIEVIQAYNDYYNQCEALLDSINSWDESFMDTIVETDAYFEYEVAKSRVKFLNNMEDNANLTWKDYKQFLKNNNLKPYQQNLKD